MSKTASRRKVSGNPRGPSREAREAQRRELARSVKTEKAIQKLARTLDSEMQRTNDRLQALGIALASRARALEAERDTDAALSE